MNVRQLTEILLRLEDKDINIKVRNVKGEKVILTDVYLLDNFNKQKKEILLE